MHIQRSLQEAFLCSYTTRRTVFSLFDHHTCITFLFLLGFCRFGGSFWVSFPLDSTFGVFFSLLRACRDIAVQVVLLNCLGSFAFCIFFAVALETFRRACFPLFPFTNFGAYYFGVFLLLSGNWRRTLFLLISLLNISVGR